MSARRRGRTSPSHRRAEVKTVTLRNLPPALARAIRRRADEDGTSLARAVIALLEERLRLSGPAQRRVYHDLDELAGSWTDEEAAAFEGALADQRRIDTGLWE